MPQQIQTKLTKRPVSSVEQSVYRFGDGRGLQSGEIPLVLEPPYKPFGIYVAVPHGVYAISTWWDKIEGVLEPGFHWLPPWRHIPWVVCAQHVPVNFPIKKCPTLDNVMIEINILTTIRVEDPIKFVTTVGPYKLNEMLLYYIEEAIRSVARSVTYYEAYEIRGRQMSDMARSLNDRLKDYGVAVFDVTVEDIILPKQLVDSMQKQAAFVGLQRCRMKEHSFNIQKQQNSDKLLLRQLERRNEMLKYDEEAKKTISLINKTTSEVVAYTDKKLAEIKSLEAAEVMKIQYQAELEAAKLDGQKNRDYIITVTEGAKNAEIVKAKTKAYTVVKKSEAVKTVAENKAKALTTLADAEAKCAANLRLKRKFILDNKQLDVIRALASNPDAVISGSSNYSPISQLSGSGLSGALSLMPLVK